MALDPQAKILLKQMEEQGRTETSTLTTEQSRAQIAEIAKLAGTPEDVANIENRIIPVKDGEIKICIYTPTGKGPFPVFVYFHGGGWVIGDLETVDTPCRNIANAARCIVVSVDYRLAPEYKFPVATEDCYEATKWVAIHAGSFNGDSSRIAVGGDSAGGNLATVVTILSKERGGPELVSQVLIYPSTNLAFDAPSFRENGEGYFLTLDSLNWFKSHYLRSIEDETNPYAAPLLYKNLRNLPPALIITAEYDPMRDDGKAYANRLKEFNVDVTYTCYEGMIHGFFWMAGIMNKGKQAVAQVSNYLQSSFELVKK